MGRLVALLLVLIIFVGLPVWYAWWRQPRLRRQIDRRQIVIDEVIQQNTRDNYELLEAQTRFIERLLAADEAFTMLSTRQRDEGQALVNRFNQKQLDK